MIFGGDKRCLKVLHTSVHVLCGVNPHLVVMLSLHTPKKLSEKTYIVLQCFSGVCRMLCLAEPASKAGAEKGACVFGGSNQGWSPESSDMPQFKSQPRTGSRSNLTHLPRYWAGSGRGLGLTGMICDEPWNPPQSRTEVRRHYLGLRTTVLGRKCSESLPIS